MICFEVVVLCYTGNPINLVPLVSLYLFWSSRKVTGLKLLSWVSYITINHCAITLEFPRCERSVVIFFIILIISFYASYI